MQELRNLDLKSYRVALSNDLARIRAVAPETAIGKAAQSAVLIRAKDARALIASVCGEVEAVASGLMNLKGPTPPWVDSRLPWGSLPMSLDKFVGGEGTPRRHEEAAGQGSNDGQPHGERHGTQKLGRAVPGAPEYPGRDPE